MGFRVICCGVVWCVGSNGSREILVKEELTTINPLCITLHAAYMLQERGELKENFRTTSTSNHIYTFLFVSFLDKEEKTQASYI